MQAKRTRFNNNKRTRWSPRFGKTKRIAKIKVNSNVLCQKDHLKLICYFLTINDIFQTIPLISQFHTRFINHVEQKRLIETCISYDDLQGVFESLKIFPLKYKNDEVSHENTSSISKQLSNVYGIDSWDNFVAAVTKTIQIKKQYKEYFETNYHKTKNAKSGTLFYNLNYLLILRNVAMIQIWLPKVEYMYFSCFVQILYFASYSDNCISSVDIFIDKYLHMQISFCKTYVDL